MCFCIVWDVERMSVCLSTVRYISITVTQTTMMTSNHCCVIVYIYKLLNLLYICRVFSHFISLVTAEAPSSFNHTIRHLFLETLSVPSIRNVGWTPIRGSFWNSVIWHCWRHLKSSFNNLLRFPWSISGELAELWKNIQVKPKLRKRRDWPVCAGT